VDDGEHKVGWEGIEDMKALGVWLKTVSHWLVAWLISKWGVALVLIGTLALAVSTSVYLTGTYDHRAQVGVSVPGAIVAIPVQSWCTTVAGVPTCTSTLPAIPIHCTLSQALLAQSEGKKCTPSNTLTRTEEGGTSW
jgi:hypothetical protein